jgi:hypothetical protein
MDVTDDDVCRMNFELAYRDPKCVKESNKLIFNLIVPTIGQGDTIVSGLVEAEVFF